MENTAEQARRVEHARVVMTDVRIPGHRGRAHNGRRGCIVRAGVVPKVDLKDGAEIHLNMGSLCHLQTGASQFSKSAEFGTTKKALCAQKPTGFRLCDTQVCVRNAHSRPTLCSIR